MADGNTASYLSSIRKITTAGNVTTLAQTAVTTSGFYNLGTINQIAVDSSGTTLYVPDSAEYVIRKLTISSGTLSTFAGSGTSTTVDGTGTAAGFGYPLGIALTSGGTLYVSDGLFIGSTIRKITASAVVTTLAGSDSALGSTNGTTTAARFNYAYGLALDSSGNLYVADVGNNLIRKVTAAGVVTTLAGSGSAGAANGTGTAASFNKPLALSTDSAGNVYVADAGNNLIRKITAAGVVTTLAGTGVAGSADGAADAASFSNPAGIVYSNGKIYVGDSGNRKVRVITP